MLNDAICGAPTVKDVVALTVPKVAEMFAIPCVAAEARPVELIVDTAGAEELQETLLLRFCVLPSVKVPVATNC